MFHLCEFDDLDTIVVASKEDGFKDVFLGEKCWYQIRISAVMLSWKDIFMPPCELKVHECFYCRSAAVAFS